MGYRVGWMRTSICWTCFRSLSDANFLSFWSSSVKGNLWWSAATALAISSLRALIAAVKITGPLRSAMLSCTGKRTCSFLLEIESTSGSTARLWDSLQTIPRGVHIEKYLNKIDSEGKQLETWTSLKTISRISDRTGKLCGRDIYQTLLVQSRIWTLREWNLGRSSHQS